MLVVIVPNLQSGGTEWQTYFLIRELAANYRITLWVYSDSRTDPLLHERYQGISRLEIFYGGKIKTIIRLAQRRPKLILSYAINYYVPEILLSTLTGAALITERRNLYHWTKHDKRKVVQESIRNILTCAVICNSQTVASKVGQTERHVRKKLHVVYNSINEFAIRPVKNTKQSIIAVSNVKKGKGLEVVLQVFQHILGSRLGNAVNLAIFGRLDDSDVFAGFSEQFLAEVYKGHADQQEIYGSALCLLHISESEGFPNSVLEAASVGVIPILSDIPVHRELFEECAFFVSSLAEAIDVTTNIISLSLEDSDQIHKLSGRCRVLASRYSLSERVGRYTRIINAHLS